MNKTQLRYTIRGIIKEEFNHDTPWDSQDDWNNTDNVKVGYEAFLNGKSKEDWIFHGPPWRQGWEKAEKDLKLIQHKTHGLYKTSISDSIRDRGDKVIQINNGPAINIADQTLNTWVWSPLTGECWVQRGTTTALYYERCETAEEFISLIMKPSATLSKWEL